MNQKSKCYEAISKRRSSSVKKKCYIEIGCDIVTSPVEIRHVCSWADAE